MFITTMLCTIVDVYLGDICLFQCFINEHVHSFILLQISGGTTATMDRYFCTPATRETSHRFGTTPDFCLKLLRSLVHWLFLPSM